MGDISPGGGGGGVSYEGRGEVSIPDKMSNLGCQINFMGLIKGCLVWCTSVQRPPSPRGLGLAPPLSAIGQTSVLLVIFSSGRNSGTGYWHQIVGILSRELSRDFNLSCSEYKYLEYGEGLRVKIFIVGSFVENHNSCLVLTSKLFL